MNRLDTKLKDPTFKGSILEVTSNAGYTYHQADKQNVIVWSLLEKMPQLYEDPHSEKLILFALNSAIEHHGTTEIITILKNKPDLVKSTALLLKIMAIDVFSLKQRNEIYTLMKQRLPEVISSAEDLFKILAHKSQTSDHSSQARNTFTPGQCKDIYDMFQEKFTVITHSVNDFFQVLEHYEHKPQKRAKYHEAMKDKLPEITQTVNDFIRVLKYGSLEDQAKYYNDIKDNLSEITSTINEICYVLNTLTPEQHADFYEKVKYKLPYILRRARGRLSEELPKLFSAFTQQSSDLYKILKDELLQLISGCYSFTWVFEHIPKEEKQDFYVAIKNKLVSSIEKNNDISDVWFVLRYLSPEQCADFYSAIKHKLPALIKVPSLVNRLVIDKYEIVRAHENFAGTLKYLNQQDRTDLYETVKNYIPTMVSLSDRRAQVINTVLQYLLPSQCEEVCNAIPKLQLSSKIKTIEDFCTVLKNLSLEQTECVSRIIQSKLSIFKSIDDFNKTKEHLSPEQQVVLRHVLTLDAIKRTFSLHHAQAFHSAMKSNDPKMIKTEIDHLISGINSKKYRLVYFSSETRSITQLTESILYLELDWLDKIKTALDLQLTHEQLTDKKILGSCLEIYAQKLMPDGPKR